MKDAIYLFRSSSNRQMMGLILTTAEGGIFLVDGGYDFDAPDLLKDLREITGEEKPHLDAIWLTHPHNDHITAFNELIKNHADEFSFDRIFFRFPSAQFLKDDGDVGDLIEFYSLMPKFADRMIFPSEGDSYSIRGAKFEILYTTDAIRGGLTSPWFLLAVGVVVVLFIIFVTVSSSYSKKRRAKQHKNKK